MCLPSADYGVSLFIAAGMISLALVTSPADGVVLRGTDAIVHAAGERAEVCVELDTQGEEVVGTQNELVWDTTCATLSSSADCTAGGSFPNGEGLPPTRVFFGSLDEPLADGELYCCSFVSELTEVGCCPIAVQNARAGDSTGRVLSTSAIDGSICFELVDDPTEDDQNGDNSGCELIPAHRQTNGALHFSVCVVLLLALRRRASPK
jgi:hypothetical protein